MDSFAMNNETAIKQLQTLRTQHSGSISEFPIQDRYVKPKNSEEWRVPRPFEIDPATDVQKKNIYMNDPFPDQIHSGFRINQCQKRERIPPRAL